MHGSVDANHIATQGQGSNILYGRLLLSHIGRNSHWTALKLPYLPVLSDHPFPVADEALWYSQILGLPKSPDPSCLLRPSGVRTPCEDHVNCIAVTWHRRTIHANSSRGYLQRNALCR